VTNKFERVIGEGGFGIVYHGHLNDTEQVAVKLLSHSSTQGYKQFKAEVLLACFGTNPHSIIFINKPIWPMNYVLSWLIR
jgi:serine/threonine protein kinase